MIDPATCRFLLIDKIERDAARPFDWAASGTGINCVSWAAEWVKELGGPDLYRKWRKQVVSREMAEELIDNQGGLEKMVTAALKLEPYDRWQLMQVGDIGMFEGPMGLSLGVCDSFELWAPTLPHGLAPYAKIDEILHGWPVGSYAWGR